MRYALVLLAALVLTGCEKAQSDRVRDSVRTFIRAYADGDVKTACSLLVPEVRDAFDNGCEADLKQESDALSDAERTRLRELELGDVDVRGDEARVRLRGQRGSEAGTLRKVDGRWLIENR